MIETTDFSTLILNAFTGKTTWLWASQQYTLDDFIDTFQRTRASMQRTVDGLTDGQAAFHMDGVSTWSLSETITHLIFSQGFYYNALLDISDSRIPHVVEAARGFGEGGRQNVSADELQTMLRQATTLIDAVIAKTRSAYDPTRIKRNPFFGEVTYATWILLLTAHEVDHVRQSIVMRRYARINVPSLAGEMAAKASATQEVSSDKVVVDAPSTDSPVVPVSIPVQAVNSAPSTDCAADQGTDGVQEAGSGNVVTP